MVQFEFAVRALRDLVTAATARNLRECVEDRCSRSLATTHRRSNMPKACALKIISSKRGAADVSASARVRVRSRLD